MALTDVKSEQIQSSVALAGSPTTTTQSASDNSTKIATTAYVETAVANLVASAPSALNTLDELAAALNDDASFSTTITNSLATKLPLAGGTMSGALNMGSQNITNAGTIAGTLTTAAQTNITSVGTLTSLTSGAHLINASSSAFGGSSVQGFNTDFLVDTGQGYSRHNSYHTGGSNHQFLVNATGSTTNTVALSIDKDANATFAGKATVNGELKIGTGSYTNSQYYASDVVLNAANEGGLTIASSANTHGSYIMFADGVSSGSEQYAGYIEYNHNVDRMRLKSNGDFLVYGVSLGADALAVKSDGKVGIGITSGLDRDLHIKGSGTDVGIQIEKTGAHELRVAVDSTGPYLYAEGTAPLRFYQNNGEVIRISGSNVRVHGLLGVNKAVNTAVALSVGADSTATNSYGLEVTNASANTRFLVDGVGNSYFYKTDNNVGVKWDATNGRLGIGTGVSALSYALTVSGESSIGDFSANGFANLGRNADGNQDVTTLGGYGVDAGSGTRYGRYGALRFRSSANYTAGSRGYMITNGYGANKFAILQSSNATTMPSLGSYGGVSGGTAPFIMDNTGDITLGYQPVAYGRITGNPSGPSADYGLPLTTDYSRNITAQTNSTHGPGITITKAGVYIMSMSFLYDPVGTYVYIGWCVNGSIIHHWHSNHAISGNHDGHSSIARYLNVGDHLTIERTTANGMNIYGNTHSYWWVCKVG